MKASLIIGSCILGLIGLFLLVFGVPIYNVHMDDCEVVEVEINGFHGYDESKDIAVHVKDGEGRYYINRGLEAGLDVAQLEAEALNQKASIHYAKHWSLLNYDRKHRHVSRITVGDKILFNEIRE